MCPNCRRPDADCTCRRDAAASAAAGTPGDSVVRVGRETKGRQGKGVTVVSGVPLPPADLADLCTQLKKQCGSGGAVKNGVIEIQGDHRDRLADELARRGWTVKRSGG